MKKLKRRLSHAFKSGSSLNLSFENNNPTSSSLPTGSSLTKNGADRNDSNGHRHASENDHECNGNNTSHIAAYDNTYNTANLDGSFSSCSSLSIPSVSLSLANCAHPVVPPTSYNPNGPNTGASRYVAESGTGGLGYAGRGQQYRSWSRLSDSMNHLADRLAQDGIIVEEYNMDDISTNQQNIDSKSSSTKSSQQLNIPNRPSVPNYNSTNSRHYSMNGNQRLQPAPLMNKLISNHSHHQLSTLASNPNIANKDFSNGGALNASNRGYLGSTSANNRANASGSTNTMMTSLSLSKPCLQTANSLNTQRHSHGSLLDIQMIDSYNGYPNVENSNKNSLPSFVTMRPSKQSNTFSSADASMQAEAKKTSRNANKEMKKKSRNSWHASRWFFGNHNGRASSAVVHESSALGSDGESLEVSPCTSDQMSNSSFYPCSSSMYGVDGDRMGCQYVPNVKMRQKLNNRRWSEQDIQKRLSLPADIKLPQTVIEKLNRTPTLDNPLTRKSRRASLSEIGFGKLETYKKIFDLGEGTYATVYLGKSLLTGKSVALKEIRLEHEEGAPCTAIREVSLLRNLKHANVVTLHDIIYTERVLTLVFEFVEHDLREYMEEIESMICMNNVKLFLVQLLRGLAYCHKRRILHRDLKPQNLLINRAGELKLADFGLARAQSVPTKTYSNEVVTLWYRPPDVLLGSTDYSTHIDMWGVGCILFEMLEHKPMFPGSTTDEQLNLIFQKLGTPSPDVYPNLCALPLYKSNGYKSHSVKSLLNSDRINQERADLLLKMLKYDGRSRIQAADALRHPMLAANFPPDAVLSLPDTESVLSLPGVSYISEQPGVRKPAK